jgi:hypothetical protein
VATVVVVLALVPARTARAAAPVTAQKTWQANGDVTSVAYAGNVLYLGGTFTTLSPPAGTTGTPVARPYLAALDATTGAPLPWNPAPDGEVKAVVASPDGSTVYLAGAFTHVGGLTRKRLAAVDASSGQPTSWAPVLSSNGKTLALTPDGSRLFVGGYFTTVNGVARKHLAAFSTATGALDQTWQPDPDGTVTYDKGVLAASGVNALVVSSDGSTLYLGGVFTTISGVARNNGAAVSTTGTATPTAFDLSAQLPDAVLSVSRAPDTSTVVYTGRGPGGFVKAVDPSTGALRWYRHVDGDVQAAAASGYLFYAGGHFNYLDEPDGTQAHRQHLLALTMATGSTDPWNPTLDSDYGAFALAYEPGRLAAGGAFTAVNGLAQAHVAQFAGGDSEAPTVPGTPVASATVPGTVHVSWTASTDLDDTSVSYHVWRDGSVVATVTGPAGSGTVSFDDVGLPGGSSHSYAVDASDSVYRSAPSAASQPVVVRTDDTLPSSPGQPTATTCTCGPGVWLAWAASSDVDNATLAYTVLRTDVATGTETEAVTVSSASASTVSTVDTTAPGGGTYTYRVRASDGNAPPSYGPASGPLTVPVDQSAPTVPSGVKAVSRNANTVTVTWTASTDADAADTISYRVYRDGSPAPVATTTATTFKEPLAPDTTHSYTVDATDGTYTTAQSSPPATVTVRSLIWSDDLGSLSAWTVTGAVSSDAAVFHSGAASARLAPDGRAPTDVAGATRALGASYPTVCQQEWVDVTSLDPAQTTLVRLQSSAGAVASLYVDATGVLCVRSDYSAAATSTARALGSGWHQVQLCATVGSKGSVQAWLDCAAVASVTANNGPTSISTVSFGDPAAVRALVLNVDDVVTGTTPR